MTEQSRGFGKRRPLAPPTTPPVKRSGHVALLVMGSLAVGGTAYALMPRTSCDPPAPGTPQTEAACTTRSSSGGGGGSGSRFYDSSNSGRTNVADAESGRVSRGGFGSFARAFAFSRGG
ncbi:hypothetical protein [Bradyrhizobium sp. STM 3557]|uniref:hypothetical protein n=1 Tax=Bradyrhizobium sp. STM 3557 TaxID=578920 RepID=UPI003891195D